MKEPLINLIIPFCFHYDDHLKSFKSVVYGQNYSHSQQDFLYIIQPEEPYDLTFHP